jgi:hypothetical protein
MKAGHAEEEAIIDLRRDGRLRVARSFHAPCCRGI